jgi:hypothetical protein
LTKNIKLCCQYPVHKKIKRDYIPCQNRSSHPYMKNVRESMQCYNVDRLYKPDLVLECLLAYQCCLQLSSLPTLYPTPNPNTEIHSKC